MAEIKAPPSINLPALRPIEPNSVPEMTDKPTNGSSNGSLVTRKIKACPELPPGKMGLQSLMSVTSWSFSLDGS